MHIVLLEPEIPQNAGNIARTCAVTNTVLHLIKPLGFSVEDKYLKRAGLDYWKLLDIRYYENFQDFLDKNPNAKIWMATTKAKHVYSDVTFGENDYLMFGKESAGIPEEILLQYPDTAIRIPMLEAARSLNLSNSVAIIIYEALRQQGFLACSRKGSCTVTLGQKRKQNKNISEHKENERRGCISFFFFGVLGKRKTERNLRFSLFVFCVGNAIFKWLMLQLNYL